MRDKRRFLKTVSMATLLVFFYHDDLELLHVQFELGQSQVLVEEQAVRHG